MFDQEQRGDVGLLPCVQHITEGNCGGVVAAKMNNNTSKTNIISHTHNTTLNQPDTLLMSMWNNVELLHQFPHGQTPELFQAAVELSLFSGPLNGPSKCSPLHPD